MARQFDDGSSQYLEVDTPPTISDYPFTVAAWFKSDDLTVLQALLTFVDQSAGNVHYGLRIRGDVGGDPVESHARNTTSRYAQTSSGYSANTWHHACGLLIGDASRSAYIDGGSVGTNAQAATYNAGVVDRTSIGRIGDASPGQEMSGAIAEVAVWDVELSAVEVLELATGFSPMFIRRGSLIHYWRLLNNDKDCVGGLDMTATNNPTWTDHPKIIYPCGPF